MSAQTEQSRTLRLVFPQWQGGADPGYSLGSQILHLLLPQEQQQLMRVPVSHDLYKDTPDGLSYRERLAVQTKDALKLIAVSKPERILTLGGDCSVSLAPFSYLAQLYADDLCVLWLDAHPDLSVPGERHKSLNSMALSTLLGLGDELITAKLPTLLQPWQVMLAGVHCWENPAARLRAQQLQLACSSPAELTEDFAPVLSFLQRCPCRYLAVHLDLDVIDPSSLDAAAGSIPGGMALHQVMDLVVQAASCKNLVGLSITELLPRSLLQLRRALLKLPLVQP